MPFDNEPAPEVVAFANGLRLVLLPLPQARTAAVSVYVGTGTLHEPRPLNGISHVVEHMVFKGTATRSAARINQDAERLGADLNAHTDKDHTAFHLRGLGEHAPAFVELLADLVTHPTFPAEEFEREREVLLQELAEEDDDPLAMATRLFDRACWGLQPMAWPVMGSRASLQRLRRDDLVRHVAERFVPRQMVVTATGPIDPDAVKQAVADGLGHLPTGEPLAAWPAPRHAGGGVRSRHMAGSSQAHVVMGLPCAGRGPDDPVAELAAAVLGEGMSSPLLDELRERRGLAYYAACAADVLQPAGQFVLEASIAPQALDEALGAMAGLLQAHARRIDPVELARARNQLAVRWLRQLEKPARRMEEAALDLLALGRVRRVGERWQTVCDITPEALAAWFGLLLEAGLTVGVAGGVGRGVSRRVVEALHTAAWPSS